MSGPAVFSVEAGGKVYNVQAPTLVQAQLEVVKLCGVAVADQKPLMGGVDVSDIVRSPYEAELWTRHDRLSDGMAALSAVTMPDAAAQRAAHEVLADARAIVLEQISQEVRRG